MHDATTASLIFITQQCKAVYHIRYTHNNIIVSSIIHKSAVVSHF